eukprot:7227628-Prymnesium_polylepis.1
MAFDELYAEKIRLDIPSVHLADDDDLDLEAAAAAFAAKPVQPTQPMAQDNATVPVARAAALEELPWNELLAT